MMVWIIFTLIIVVSFVGSTFLKNNIFNKLLKDMQKQDFDTFFKRLDSFTTKLFYAPFNREYMRLNAYFLMGDEKKIKEQFDLILTLRMSKKQDIDISLKAFYFYIDDKNKQKTEEMLQRIQKCGNEEIYTQCKIMSAIVIDKSIEYIDDMEAQVKQCEGIDRGMFHYLLGLQYLNKKDTPKAMEHLQSAQKDLKDSPYNSRIIIYFRTVFI